MKNRNKSPGIFRLQNIRSELPPGIKVESGLAFGFQTIPVAKVVLIPFL